jgi:hypothetical protein
MAVRAPRVAALLALVLLACEHVPEAGAYGSAPSRPLDGHASAPAVEAGAGGTAGGEGGHAGTPTAGGTLGGGEVGTPAVAAGAGGEDGSPEQPPQPPQHPTPSEAAPCDADGPGGITPGWPVLWTVPAGWCVTWTGADAADPEHPGVRHAPDTAQPAPADAPACAAYTHDPGTGVPVSSALGGSGVLSVYPGEPARGVRLPEGVDVVAAELVPLDGGALHCPGTSESAAAVRTQCVGTADGGEGACFSETCCYVAEARATACDGVPMCDGVQ